MNDAPADVVLRTLTSHTSIRRFTDDPVSDVDLSRAIEAGQCAATSSNIQAYCAIRVSDTARLTRLVNLHHVRRDSGMKAPPDEGTRGREGETETPQRHQPPVLRLDPGRTDPLVPGLARFLVRRFWKGALAVTRRCPLEDHAYSSLS